MGIEGAKHTMSEWLVEIVIAIVTFILGGYAGLIRLEVRMNQAAKDHDSLERRHEALESKHDKLDDKVMDKLAEMSNTLARIEERLFMKERTRKGDQI